MATLPSDRTRLELAPERNARSCAPHLVATLLESVLAEWDLALVLDVDALERSAFARIDRIMQFSLVALSRTRVTIYLAARDERQRALIVQRSIPGARFMTRSASQSIPVIRASAGDSSLLAISDDPEVFATLRARDRGLALGRPELSRGNVKALADSAVRATLWWLYEARAQALAS